MRIKQFAFIMLFILGIAAMAIAATRRTGSAHASVSQGTGLHSSVNSRGHRVLMQSSHQPLVPSSNKNGARVMIGIQATARTLPEVKTGGWQIH